MAEEQEEQSVLEDQAVALDDVSSSDKEEPYISSIVRFVNERYKRASDYRRSDEQRWLRAYRNYRGIYGPDVQFSEAEKSRVFVKTTKTKTLGAYAQIQDVLFANNKFPINIEPTTLPEGVSESVHVSLQPNMAEPPAPEPEFKGDGQELPPGYRSGMQLGPLKE